MKTRVGKVVFPYDLENADRYAMTLGGIGFFPIHVITCNRMIVMYGASNRFDAIHHGEEVPYYELKPVVGKNRETTIEVIRTDLDENRRQNNSNTVH